MYHFDLSVRIWIAALVGLTCALLTAEIVSSLTEDTGPAAVLITCVVASLAIARRIRLQKSWHVAVAVYAAVCVLIVIVALS